MGMLSLPPDLYKSSGARQRSIRFCNATTIGTEEFDRVWVKVIHDELRRKRRTLGGIWGAFFRTETKTQVTHRRSHRKVNTPHYGDGTTACAWFE